VLAGLAEGAEAVVDVGARITNMVIHDNGVLRFVGILLMGSAGAERPQTGQRSERSCAYSG
jgi:hypothetical protein